MSRSMLIIGASGRLGGAIIREASRHPSRPSIHAFVRTPSKLPSREASLCTTIQKGDALRGNDLARAIRAARPDTIIVTIGIPKSTAPTNLREKSAKALTSVLNHAEFAYLRIRVVCVSRLGAGGSTIKSRMGVGQAMGYRVKRVLKDHSAQERTFWRGVGRDRARLMVVRPTGMTEGKQRGQIMTFGDEDRAPSMSIDREEVAYFIIDQICGNGMFFGHSVNIASTEQKDKKGKKGKKDKKTWIVEGLEEAGELALDIFL